MSGAQAGTWEVLARLHAFRLDHGACRPQTEVTEGRCRRRDQTMDVSGDMTVTSGWVGPSRDEQ